MRQLNIFKLDVLYKSGASRVFTFETPQRPNEIRDYIARIYNEGSRGVLNTSTAIIDISATATIDLTVIFEI
jgi:hypothetical protein